METKEKTLLRLRLDPETAFVGTPATQRKTAARFVQLDIIIIIIIIIIIMIMIIIIIMIIFY